MRSKAGWQSTRTSTSITPPTYRSWLNQVELWFAIERDCIERGIFTSTHDLKRKLLADIDLHNKEAHPCHSSMTQSTSTGSYPACSGSIGIRVRQRGRRASDRKPVSYR